MKLRHGRDDQLFGYLILVYLIEAKNPFSCAEYILWCFVGKLMGSDELRLTHASPILLTHSEVVFYLHRLRVPLFRSF